jgi:hypothetical protein
MMTRCWKFALFAIAYIATAAPAWAGLLPVSATVTPDGSNYRYTYGIVLTSDTQLRSGDYFTIFDFANPISKSAVMPTGWTLSMAPLGGNPNGIVPGDSPTIPNLTYTYHGSTITGQVGLGNFSIDSNVGASSNQANSFASITQRSIDGANDSNITAAVVPNGTATTQGGGGGTSGVPEPSTLLLLGIGLPIAALVRRFRGRSAVAV